MADVDPDDDAVDRWIVHWYRYDPTRRERRNTVVAAFDNEHALRDLGIGRTLTIEIECGASPEG